MTIPAHIAQGGSEIVVGNGRNAPTGGAGPVERISVVAAVLPCPGCAHAPVCAIRPYLNPEKLSLRTPAAPHEAIRIRMTLELECEHFLAGNFPEPAPAGPVRVNQALRDTASRQRGAAGLVQTGLKRSPEARERMRVEMVASYARRQAAASSSGVPE